jgi:peptide/nickel transport system ATP-binding protein
MTARRDGMDCVQGGEADAQAKLLEVTAVSHAYDVSAPWLHRLVRREPRRLLRAADQVSFGIPRGTTLALVGESGCGKSTVARLAVGLLPPASGEVRFAGQALSAVRTQPALRRRINMVFQDPFGSLNPRWRVRDIVAEPIRRFRLADTRAAVRERVEAALLQVGLAPADADRFPHAFSGGQRQRISIARALASEPSLLVADEPTSALDVSVQAQILNLLRDLQQRLGLTYLLISHNLAVVRQMADAVAVMYLGRIVEHGPADALFRAPLHPYTRMLMESVPGLDGIGRDHTDVRGDVPDPLAPPPGCPFHPRCPLAMTRCREERPEPTQIGAVAVACHAAAGQGAGG